MTATVVDANNTNLRELLLPIRTVRRMGSAPAGSAHDRYYCSCGAFF